MARGAGCSKCVAARRQELESLVRIKANWLSKKAASELVGKLTSAHKVDNGCKRVARPSLSLVLS